MSDLDTSEEVELTEAQELAYTNSIRKNIISAKMKDVANLDPKDLNVILAAADGIDRVALVKLKLKNDTKNTATLGNAAGNIALLLRSVGNNTTYTPNAVSAGVPVLPDTLEDIQMVPGETQQGTNPLSYEKILSIGSDLQE